jgi:hypothetical protein
VAGKVFRGTVPPYCTSVLYCGFRRAGEIKRAKAGDKGQGQGQVHGNVNFASPRLWLTVTQSNLNRANLEKFREITAQTRGLMAQG